MSAYATTDLVTSEIAAQKPDQTASPHFERYSGPLRPVAGVLAGLAVETFLIGSVQLGVRFVETVEYSQSEWNILDWFHHWMWLGVGSLATSGVAGFVAGMVARRRGGRVAVFSALPAAAYWAFTAITSLMNNSPIGYRIVATILTIVTLPVTAVLGAAGESYGRANAEHFDLRRRTLLGVPWYDYLWLPFLGYAMVTVAAFGFVYDFGPAYDAALVPLVAFLGLGALGTYKALAGLDGKGGSVWRRVVQYGFGHTLASAAGLCALALIHHGVKVFVLEAGAKISMIISQWSR